MKIRLLLLLFFINHAVSAQKSKKLPEFDLQTADVESDIRFIASDELMGRKVGQTGNNVAARYIAEQFRRAGVKPINGQDYFQEVKLKKVFPTQKGSISADTLTLKLVDDFVLLAGTGIDVHAANIVQLPYAFTAKDGSYDDFKNVDVKGKVILTQMGTPDATNPQQIFAASRQKRILAKENGAIALIEVYALPIPWLTVRSSFSKESFSLDDQTSKADITHLWLNFKTAKSFFEAVGNKITMQIAAGREESVISKNVVGIIEGTNPKMKNQYVALTAHYDHIGFGAAAGRVSAEDSIFNGARDNAIGTSAVLSAARTFATQPAERSILLIAYTGEEVGLLGSKFYAAHPLIPMKDVIFNLNCDGAGYNDTTKITVIGLDRTSARSQIEEGGKTFGLTVINDPVPEQGLFDRSDNVSFAAVGVPAPNFAPGTTAFDAQINKYYHQAADNPESLDMNYVKKYCQSFIYAARMVANDPKVPVWAVGDKYENISKTLYQK